MTPSAAPTESFDVIVVGGGHAGCEAAITATRVALNAALDRLATYSTDPTTIQVNAYGVAESDNALLATIYQDLFSNQSFDNSSSSWSYTHQIIQSLQDLNL